MVVVVALSDRSRLLRVASVSHHRHFLTLIFLGNFWVRALPEMQGVRQLCLIHTGSFTPQPVRGKEKPSLLGKTEICKR